MAKAAMTISTARMNREEYIAFRNELVTAKRADVANFDKEIVFEGCMPIETMATRRRHHEIRTAQAGRTC